MDTKTLGIVSEKIAVENTIKTSLASYVLKERMSDEEIEAVLPEKHIFEVKEVYLIIGALMFEQSKGEEGALLNKDSYANLFYTPSFVVRVDWGADRGGWGVDAWSRGGCEWDGGHRVFSPAN